MTKDEIIDEEFSDYMITSYSEGEMKFIKDAMEFFAKQESIAFTKWILESDWHWSVSRMCDKKEDVWYEFAHYGTFITHEQLHQLYLKSKTND